MRLMVPISGFALAALAVSLQAERQVTMLPPLAPDKVLAAFRPGLGRAETAKSCGLCHAPAMITGKRYSADKWADTVDHMVDKGAKVSDADYDLIVNYLARAYGTAAALPVSVLKPARAKHAASRSDRR